MWEPLPQPNRRDAKLNETIQSLMEETLVWLIYGTAIILLGWFFVVGLLSTDLLLWRFWVALAFAILIARGSILLVNHHLLAASYFWLGGLFILNLLFVFLLNRPEAIFFLAFFPLQAVIVLGWPAGIAAIGMVAAVLMEVGNTPVAPLIQPFSVVILAGSFISGFLGWMSARSLTNQVLNTLYFSRLASSNLMEAREHRGQMFKVLKDLDLAYYRLERANASLVAAWKEAENAERFKAEFVTYVSHEMRTPLNLIMGFSETVLTSPESYGGVVLPGPYRADVNKIYQNAHHLMALVDDIIDLSRANVNRISLSPEKVDVHGLVNETVEMVRDYIQTKGLQLQVSLSEGVDILLVDRLRIRQVLLNLLVNAARFTEQGKIELSVAPSQDQAIFRISDTGKGIAEVELETIFEEYHTSGNQTGNWHSGSGLGLPISKKLVELHGGRMGVENKIPIGATFWFTLPLNVEAELQVQKLAGVQPFSALPYQPASSGRIAVLVHEDSGTAKSIQRLSKNLRFLQASSLSEGLEISRDNHALALMMPKWTSPDPYPPNLLVVECALPGSEQLARQLRVNAVLEKPVTSSDLIETIQRVCPQAEKILIADDEVEIVELFQRYLAPHFPKEVCAPAYNGLAALESIRENQPDLLLLDLRMPEMSGEEVLRAIQSDPSLNNLKIIVISGTVDETASQNIESPICLSHANGFNLLDAVQIIEGAVNTLAPGWQ